MATKPKRPRDPMQLAKLIGDIATGQRPDDSQREPESPATVAKRKGGVKGGKARAKKLSVRKKRTIAKLGAARKWENYYKSKDKKPVE